MNTDQSTKEKSGWNSMSSVNVWSLETIDSCKNVCKTAFYASLWSGMLSPIIFYIIGTGALGTEIQLQMGGLDWTILVESVIFMIAGYYTMKGSRVAAVILFLFFVIGQIGTMIATGGKLSGTGSVVWFLIYGYAVVASFKWKKLLQKNDDFDVINIDVPIESKNEDFMVKDKVIKADSKIIGEVDFEGSSVVIQKKRFWSENNIRIIVIVILSLAALGFSQKNTILNYFNNLDQQNQSYTYHESLNDYPLESPSLIEQFQVTATKNKNALPPYDWDDFSQRIEHMTTGEIEKELLSIEQSSDIVLINNAKIVRANLYSNEGLYDKSNRILLNLIDNYDFDNYSTLYSLLCLNYSKLKDFSTAEGYCSKLVFADLDNDMQGLVVAVYISLGNNKRALELVDEGLSLHSGNIALIYSRAAINISKNLKLDSEKDSIINDIDFVINHWTGEDTHIGRMYILKGYAQLLKDQKDIGCSNVQKGLLIDPSLGYHDLREICNLN